MERKLERNKETGTTDTKSTLLYRYLMEPVGGIYFARTNDHVIGGSGSIETRINIAPRVAGVPAGVGLTLYKNETEIPPIIPALNGAPQS